MQGDAGGLLGRRVWRWEWGLAGSGAVVAGSLGCAVWGPTAHGPHTRGRLTAHAAVDQAFCGRAVWAGLQVLDQELRAEFA
jgi:hypothetical protein